LLPDFVSRRNSNASCAHKPKKGHGKFKRYFDSAQFLYVNRLW
jgi:hypothetical protein